MAIHSLYVASNFTDTMNELPDCLLDARRWNKLLKPFCASSTLLLGKRASREGILKAGKKWLERLEPSDLGILLFSQHGTQEKINGQPHEAIVCDDLELIYDFESDDLLSHRAKRTTVAILGDVCYFGGMPRGFKHNPSKPKTIPLRRCKSHKAIPPAKMKALRNAIVYAGASGLPGDEYSYSTGHGGAMSLAMQQAFGERGMDATFGWLHRRVTIGKNRLLPSDEAPQHPTITASADNLRRTLKSFT